MTGSRQTRSASRGDPRRRNARAAPGPDTDLGWTAGVVGSTRHLATLGLRCTEELAEVVDRCSGDVSGSIINQEVIDVGGQGLGLDCAQDSEDIESVLCETIRGIPSLIDLVQLGDQESGRARDHDH